MTYFVLKYQKGKIYLDGIEITQSEFRTIKEQVTEVDKKLWYEEVKKEAEEIGKRVKHG